MRIFCTKGKPKMKKRTALLLLMSAVMLFTSCSSGVDIILPPETTPEMGGVVVRPPVTGTDTSSDPADTTVITDISTNPPDVTDAPGTTVTPETSSSPETTVAPDTGTTPETTVSGTTSDGYGLVPESAAVKPSFFDDAAFIGDSVSLKLQTYALTGVLGKAKFFAVGSFSTVNALTKVTADSCHPSYQGKKMLAEDCVAACGAKKVYIMLGMNDLVYGIDSTIDRYKTLVSRILAKSPDAEIYIQSMTPMLKTSSVWGSKLNNDKIREYNDALLQMCKEMKWYYVDVQSVMWNSAGTELKKEYCSDPNGMGLHMTSDGCKAWVEYLLTHTIKN